MTFVFDRNESFKESLCLIELNFSFKDMLFIYNMNNENITTYENEFKGSIYLFFFHIKRRRRRTRHTPVFIGKQTF